MRNHKQKGQVDSETLVSFYYGLRGVGINGIETSAKQIDGVCCSGTYASMEYVCSTIIGLGYTKPIGNNTVFCSQIKPRKTIVIAVMNCKSL